MKNLYGGDNLNDLKPNPGGGGGGGGDGGENRFKQRFNQGYNAITSMALPLQVGLLLLLIIIVLLVAYFLTVYFSYNIKGDALIPPENVLQLSNLLENEQHTITNNGDNNYSFSFWLYTNGLKTDHSKLLFYAIDAALSNTEIATTIDTDSSLKHVAAASDNSADLSNNHIKFACLLRGNDLIFIIKTGSTNTQVIIATIDFLPLTHWNHVAFTLSGDFLGLYLGGELYKVIDLNTLSAQAASPTESASSLKNIDSKFNIIVVGNKNSTYKSELTETYISRLMFIDKTLNISEVEKLYNETPYSQSLLSKLGYGFQYPIYKITYT
jgi:hypothetical protein